MPVPPYYGDRSLVIRVDPDNMFAAINEAVKKYGQGVADSLNRIVDIWNDLKLGWIGNTADEAQAFNDAWSAAMKKLFGTEVDPDVGILNHIADGVIMSSINYGGAESSVVKLFQDMSSALEQTSSGGGDTSRHLNDGPITENT